MYIISERFWFNITICHSLHCLSFWIFTKFLCKIIWVPFVCVCVCQDSTEHIRFFFQKFYRLARRSSMLNILQCNTNSFWTMEDLLTCIFKFFSAPQHIYNAFTLLMQVIFRPCKTGWIYTHIKQKILFVVVVVVLKLALCSFVRSPQGRNC